MSSTVILSVVVTANILTDLRRRCWRYVSHPISTLLLAAYAPGAVIETSYLWLSESPAERQQAARATVFALSEFLAIAESDHRPVLAIHLPGFFFHSGPNG